MVHSDNYTLGGWSVAAPKCQNTRLTNYSNDSTRECGCAITIHFHYSWYTGGVLPKFETGRSRWCTLTISH